MFDAIRRWLGGWVTPVEEPDPIDWNPGTSLPSSTEQRALDQARQLTPQHEILTDVIAILEGRPLLNRVNRTIHHLNLSGLSIKQLPEQLNVLGDLTLQSSPNLQTLGANTIVGRNLLLGGVSWSLPDWNAILARTKYVTRVMGGKAKDCPIEALPSGLEVRGNLEVKQCPRLTRMSDDMKVGGNVTFQGCPCLANFPLRECFGDLNITGAPALQSLPPGLIVHGNLTLNGVGLRELPPELVVKKNLMIGHLSRLQRWPDKLDVGGKLTIVRTPTATLPDLNKVRGNIKLIRLDGLKAIPERFVCQGSLSIQECTDLETIGEGLKVARNLSLLRCPRLVSLPRTLKVPETLNLRGCDALVHLPAELDLGVDLRHPHHQPCLVLQGTCITSLPDKSYLHGLVDVTGSALKSLPVTYQSRNVLFRNVAVPREYFFNPDSLRAEDILTQPNAELRRIALEVLGVERVLKEAKATVVDEDTDAGGPRRLLRLRPALQTIQFLQCRCPSTNREYLLRVDPTLKTCRAAAAWMAGLGEKQYLPKVET